MAATPLRLPWAMLWDAFSVRQQAAEAEQKPDKKREPIASEFWQPTRTVPDTSESGKLFVTVSLKKAGIMFRSVESSVSFPKLEEEIIRFWKERRIYEKSLAARSDGPTFVFYEGPPTANGLPHPGHCLTRAIKDLFPRYQTMRGYRCERKAGWDTHGLPVEVEVCKELGIHAKEEIEAYGVEPFIHRCLESVFRYMQAVGAAHRAAGLLDPPGRGLRHVPPELRGERLVGAEEPLRSRPALPGTQDRLVVGPGRHGPQSPAKSARAIAKWPTRASMSVFPLIDDAARDTDLLVWTTTPWTLPSNQFAAVNPDLEYSVVAVRGRAAEADPRLGPGRDASPPRSARRVDHRRHRCKAGELVGLRYVPPFDYYYKTPGRRSRPAARWRPSSTSPGGWWRPISSPPIPAPASSIRRRPSAKSTIDVLIAEQGALLRRAQGPT